MDSNLDRDLKWTEDNQSNPSSHGLGKNYLFAVGIDQYQHVAKLGNAVRDAKRFVKILSEKYRFEQKNIVAHYDEDASFGKIVSTLKYLIHELQPEDNLIVYFSGHGHYDEVLDEGYWIPVAAKYKNPEGDYISYTLLQKILGAMKAKHIVIIADSCYSGSVLVRDVAADRLEKDPSRYLLASGRNEVVPDGKKGGHSPFAEVLFELLNSYQSLGIRMGSLTNELINKVSYNSRQTPIGRSLYGVGDKGGEFVFKPKKSEKEVWDEILTANKSDKYQAYIDKYPSGKFREIAFWKKAELENRISAYNEYLQKYKNGKYHKGAQTKINRLLDKEKWKDTQAIDTAEAYQEYLKMYPGGMYITLAESRYYQLTQATDSRIIITPRFLRDSEDDASSTFLSKFLSYLIHTTQGNFVALLSLVLLVFGTYQMATWNDDTPDLKHLLLPELAVVEGGEFLMGSEEGEDDEKPLRKVELVQFSLGLHEINNQQYCIFLNENKSTRVSSWIDIQKKKCMIKWTGSSYTVQDEYAELPVVHVSWDGAKAYCDWLSKVTGEKYRLPFEKEWEYAAGGGIRNPQRWAGTQDELSLNTYAVIGKKNPEPVGSKSPNLLGLYDLSGNVREWCENDYYLYSSSSVIDYGVNTSLGKSVRGGSYDGDEEGARVAFRDYFSASDRSNPDIGFRVLKEE